MWNFRDVRSMAEKISNAVAPPPTYDDDDDEENVEEGEEEDDVSEEEVESESEGAEEIPQQSPFGLVGRLARAMDSEQNVYNESHFNEQEDADDEHMVLLPEEEEEEIDFQTHRASPVERSTSAQSADSSDRIAKVEQQHQAASFKESDTLPGDSASYRNAPVISSSFSAKLERTKENACRRKIVGRDDSIATYSSVMTPPAVDHESEHEPEPARFSLVRESGSLSPQRKHKASIGDRMGAVPPLSPRSLGSTTGGAAVILTPLKDILYAKQQKQVSGLTAASEKSVVEPDSRQLPRDPLLGSFSVAMKDYENECFEQQRNDASPIKQIMQRVPLVSEEETAVGKGLANNPPQRGPKREDSGLPPTTLLSVSSGESRASSLPSIPLDAMHEVEEEDSESENFTRPVGNQLALEAVSVPTSAEPVNQTARFESDPIPAHQNGDSKLSAMSSEEQAKKIEKLERRCKELKKQLGNAESHIIDLQQQASQIMQQDNSEHEKLMQHFQEKESRLLQAAEEEHEQILKMVRNEMDEKVTAMQRQLVEERNAFQKDREHMGVLLAEANARADKVERQVREEQSKIEKSASQIQQQQARALGMVEVKLAQTMALLDERDEKVKKQKEMIKVLESNMTEHKEGVQEVEDEMDELHSENEALHSTVESLQAECSELRKKVAKLESDSEKLVHLKMELRMLKEDHSREKAKVQNVAASAESNTAQLESERDEALAKVHDFQLQLAAALADVDVAKFDAERIMKAHSNLQAALEAFQNEREAELAMVEEDRRDDEAATAAAHAAALDATHEAHQAENRQIQRACDAAVMNSMDENKRLEEKLEMFRVENVQTRRSLDEAIKRLQATQDDVVDRTFMKNILLDWLKKTEKKEKGRVLELMASVLHFTEAEKEMVHIDEGGGLRKLVALPMPKADLDHLEGDNVREKWVNFLIAEAED